MKNKIVPAGKEWCELNLPPFALRLCPGSTLSGGK